MDGKGDDKRSIDVVKVIVRSEDEGRKKKRSR